MPKKNDNEDFNDGPWIPHFPMVVNSPQDQGVTARVNTMLNGYSVKTGGKSIFFSTAREAADAVAEGIYETLTNFEETGE